MTDVAGQGAMYPALLKHWRRQRGLSQLDLAILADVSSRHISFLETGRSRPSRAMVLRLAAALGVPLRHTDAMLVAAGHPSEQPVRPDVGDAVRAAIAMLMEHHEPFPLVVVDRAYRVVDANRGTRRMFAALLGPDRAADPDLNLALITFDPEGAQPYLANFDEVGRDLLWRIERELLADPDADELRELLDRIHALPTVADDWREVDLSSTSDPALTVHLHRDGLDLRFLVAVTAFEAPQNVAVEALRIETWFPADDATADLCRAFAALDDDTGPDGSTST